jgi:hypothetical protein
MGEWAELPYSGIKLAMVYGKEVCRWHQPSFIAIAEQFDVNNLA